MKKHINLFFYVLTISIIFFSCKKNLTEPTNTPALTKSVPKAYESLSKQGFDTVGIKDFGRYYLVEGDILIEKASLTADGKIRPNQAIENNTRLISNSRLSNPITVRIDNSVPSNGGKLDWRNEVTQAINEYNSLTTDLRLALVTTATADITVQVGTNDPSYNQVMASNVIAAAGLPSNGNPFNIVVLNSNYSATPSSGQKKYNLVHELGHCIGFRHTNWYSRAESTGLGVGSSPNSGTNPDASSVYNGGTAANSWNGFSSWDTYAISYLYPKTVPRINGSSVFDVYPGDPAQRFNPTGTITARAGSTVTVNTVINVPGSVSAFYSVSCNLPDVTYADGNHYMSRSGQQTTVYYSDVKTFIMPASGVVNWSGYIVLGNNPPGAYAKIYVR